MKTLLLLLLLAVHPQKPKPVVVYLCDSPSGKKYHLVNDCKGLSKCTHRIIKVSLESVQKSGKALCGFEK
jgi:hypothetical protein